jgi:hypothetical protein
LEKGNSATQPFVLEPIGKGEVAGTGFYRPCGDPLNGETDSEGQRICKQQEAQQTKHWSPCTEVRTLRDPLLMNQILVVGIDISDLGDLGVNVDQLKLLNINVTNQQGSAINPSPIRPSFPSTASAGGGSGSGGSPGRAEDTSGEGSWWTPMGAHPPVGTFPERWMPDHRYDPGAIVTDASGRQFYMANGGSANKGFNSGPQPSDPFPPHPRVERVLDGNVIWQAVDRTGNVQMAARPWIEGGPQAKNAIVCVARLPNGAGTGFVAPGIESVAGIRDEVSRGPILIASARPLEGLFQTPADESAGDPTEADISPECATLMLDATIVSYIRGQLTALEEETKKGIQLQGEAETFREHFEPLMDPTLVPSAAAKALHQAIEDFAGGRTEEEVIQYIKDHKGPVATPQYYWSINGGTSGSIPPDPLSILLVPRAIYLTWPYQLPGDVIPTFNVNLVYSAPAPGTFWEANTFYPAGSVVIPRVSNGHYYTALSGGISGSGATQPLFPPDTPPEVHDGALTWLDSGPAAPTVPSSPGGGNQGSAGGGGGAPGGGGGASGGASAGGATKPQLRFPNTHYLLGDVITVPETGHYYTAVESDAGFAGPPPQAGGVTPPPGGLSGVSDPFPKTPNQAEILEDNEVQWTLEFAQQDPGAAIWVKSNVYTQGERMKAANGGFYVMTGSTATSAKSGPSVQWPSNPANNQQLEDGGVVWLSDLAGTATDLWQAGQPYTVGSTVHDPQGHVYRMVGVSTGTSGLTNPSVTGGVAQPATVTDGDLLWADVGLGSLATPRPSWQAQSPYAIGQIVRSANKHDYQVIRFIGGLSGPQEKLSFPVLQSEIIVDPITEIEDAGNLSWVDRGQVCPLEHPLQSDLCKSGTLPPQWKPEAPYGDGYFIFVPGVGNGRYYQAKAQPGAKSGSTSPFLNLTPPFPITWQDTGTTTPQSVASGQPADQTVSLINLTLPQTHSLSWFNLAAGVIVDFKAPPVFGWVPASSFKGLPGNFTPAPPTSTTSATANYSVDPKTGCTISPIPPVAPATAPTGDYYAYECPAQVSTGPKPVDPVLVLTGYFPPVDAEVPWRLASRDWWRDVLPGPSIGISLSSPASNFYLGLSNEFLVRNLQLFYGVAFHDVPTTLAPGSTQPLWGGTGTAPTIGTVSRLQKGFFFGATFNLSGFIQSLFGGGASKAQ